MVNMMVSFNWHQWITYRYMQNILVNTGINAGFVLPLILLLNAESYRLRMHDSNMIKFEKVQKCVQ